MVSELQLTSNVKYEPDDSAKKRARTVSGTVPGASPPARKSVTIVLKNLPSEEFHVTPTASNNADSRQSTPEKEGTPTINRTKITNPIHTKVIKVIDLLREQRKRPKEALVIQQANKMYDLSPETTKQALDTLVQEGRIVSVSCKNTVSYRYHQGLVARGDNPTPPQAAKIKAKYSAHNSRNTAGQMPPPSLPSTKSSKRQSAFTLVHQPTVPAFADSVSQQGPQLTSSEYAMLKSFLRIISPSNRNVKPSVGEVTRSLTKKIRTLIPDDDRPTTQPGTSIYVLPPPVHVDLEKLEKSLRSLPHHRLLNGGGGSIGSSSGSISSSSSYSRHSDEKAIHYHPSHHSSLREHPDHRSILVRRNTDEGFTQVWIRSPGSVLRNAFTMEVLTELTQELKHTNNDTNVRVLVLSGSGQVFSSGINLPELVASVSQDSAAADRWANALRLFLLELAQCSKLVIAGVNGPAEGLGTTILPLCDLVYGSDTATFHVGYASLGQTPEGGASYSLASMIGLPLSNDLLLAGRQLSAREALQRGLLSDLLYPKNFPRELELRASRLAAACQTSSLSMATSKCLIRLQNQERLEFTINAECKKLSEVWKSAEFIWNANQYFRHSMNDFI